MLHNIFRLFFSVSILVLAVPAICSANMFSQSLSDETPASFFASGIEAYHFSANGISIIRYKNDKLFYGEEQITDKYKYANINIAAENILSRLSNVEMILGQNGTVQLVNTEDNYACKNNEMLNCLYSDTAITNIEVQNIMGKTEVVSVDATLPVLNEDKLNFRIGSKVYKFTLNLPVFDFSEFDDFGGLVCSKNDIGECRFVVNEGSLDKQALFELYQINPNISDVMFSESSSDGISYGFNIERGAVTPYSTECAQSAADTSQLEVCIVKTMPVGTITEKKHREGFVYWTVDYKNPKLDNEIFWVNNNGDPFRVFTNTEHEFSFKMLNKAAAQTIFEAL